MGTRNTTEEGLPCQRWDLQTPHAHTRPPNVFPEVQGAENYCRNAGGEVSRPWCYTSDPSVRWQYCDVEASVATRPTEVVNDAAASLTFRQFSCSFLS